LILNFNKVASREIVRGTLRNTIEPPPKQQKTQN
jgi:hypothetical protein